MANGHGIPLERRWGLGGRPLPLRWAVGGGVRLPERPPFDFSARMRILCADVTARCPTFAHVNPDAVMYAHTGSRTRGRFGLIARLTPLRFRDGTLYRRHRGRLYQVQRFYLNGRDMLYVLTCCLPRFLDLPFEEKLVTVFHELYHIGPAFDGDIRRHEGRCQYHTKSKKGYDDGMRVLVREYLAGNPDHAAVAFLHLNYRQLKAEYGGVYGLKIPHPKMVPVEPVVSSGKSPPG